jgi:hypothetical protein
MRINLPKFFLAAAVMAAGALTTNTAMAEKHLKVPFDFTVDGKTWPAGMYQVDREQSGNLATLKSFDASKSISFVMRPGDGAPNDNRVILKFDRIGETRALRTLQYGALTSPQFDKEHKRSDFGTGRLSQGR